jgi:hypothetical protein
VSDDESDGESTESDTVALDTPTLNAKDSVKDLIKQDGGALRVKELGSLDLSNDVLFATSPIFWCQQRMKTILPIF